MKKSLGLVIILSVLAVARLWADGVAKPFVVPELKEWKAGKGYFPVSYKTDYFLHTIAFDSATIYGN